MKTGPFRKLTICILGLLLAFTSVHDCFSSPILQIYSTKVITVEKLYQHLWVLTDIKKEKTFADISKDVELFVPYVAAKAKLDPSKTHWAVLNLKNNNSEPIDWVLIERNETNLTYFILIGNQIENQGKSGQLVKKSEEQLAAGKSWEARIPIHLAAGQSIQIYFKSYHDFQMTTPFDFKLMDYEAYESEIDQRNLLQSLIQGALGILLVFHFLLFLVNRQKLYANFSLYILLQGIFFLYITGLSREWFLGDSPFIDLSFSALPILIPSALIWTNFYWIDEQPKRSKHWKGLKLFSLISTLLFILSLLLVYSQVAAKYGFRIPIIFVMLNSLFFFFFFISHYKNGSFDIKIFLAGTFLLCLLASGAAILFYFDESLSGLLAQGALLLQIIFFAVALGYRQLKVAQEKEQSKQNLLQELKLKQEFEKELKAHFETKVRERTTALEDQKNVLLLAKKQAELANQQKSSLLSMVQHNIRNPLHAILGLSNLLQATKNEDEQSQMLNSLHIASTNLVGLVNNILDYSQIEAAEIKLEQGSFVLQQLVDQSLDVIIPMVRQKELAILLEYDPNLPYELYGCGPRLKQILSNLLHNAANFTEKGNIIFKVQLKSKTQYQALIHFCIEDSGPGIPYDLQKKILSKSAGSKAKLIPKDASDGLGLAIVSSLLELLGSQLQLESSEVDGSIFCFDLWLGLNALSKKNTSPSLVGKKILLVEDNEINQKIALRFLQQWGILVALAKNGAEALLKLDQESFDLILMDLKMPIMDGFEAAAMIRKHPKPEIRHIPIIALSASVNTEARQKAKAAGIQDFIAKPFNPKELKLQLEASLIS